MLRSIRTLLTAAGVLLAVSVVTARAADAPAIPGFRGEVIANMQEASDKIIELSGAMPTGKWTWRPGKGVRSVGEVYMHIASSNYSLCSILGATSPISAEELKQLDKAPPNPVKMAQMLRDSYAFAAQTISAMSDSDLDAQVTFFGRQVTKRAMLLSMASHSHEHLGQAIAYARVNGVVPPWTAREQAAAKAKAAEDKAKGQSR